MNIDWNEIKEKYPNKFNLLTHYLLVKIIPADRIIINSENKLVYTLYYPEFDFPICYSDLENFFDDNGIIINKYHTRYKYIFGIKNRNIKGYAGYIKNQYISKEFENYEERNKKAILKAFEILEQQIKE